MASRKGLAALGLCAVVLLTTTTTSAAAHGHGKHKKGKGENGKVHKRGFGGDVFECDGVFSSLKVKHVLVPRDGACRLTDSQVKGNVNVRKDAYFQATGTSIRKNVHAEKAQTVFIDTGSSVGGDLRAEKTDQVFVFNSTIGDDVDVKKSSDKIQICGTTVLKGDVDVRRSGTDILLGDPLTIGCAGNSVRRGDVEVSDNFTDVELVVRGNAIPRGDLEVSDNTGPSDKFVEGNVGGQRLRCNGNGTPFSGTGNTGWAQLKGQCSG